MSLQSVLKSGKFVVTAEVGPLKGIDTTEITEVAELLQGRVDATNATDQQSSVMRLGSLATCYLLKQNGLDPVFSGKCFIPQCFKGMARGFLVFGVGNHDTFADGNALDTVFL